MILPRRARGEPVLALALVMTLWIGIRVVVWNRRLEQTHVASAAEPPAPPPAAWTTRAARAPDPVPGAVAPPVPAMSARRLTGAVLFRQADRPSVPEGPSVSAPPHPEAVVAAHAAPAPAQLTPMLVNRADPARSGRAAQIASTRSHWSADAWVLLRGGGGLPSAGPGLGAGVYGDSQLGAVLRYRLGGDRGSAAYFRVANALNGIREQDFALGLSARPLAPVPVAAMAEVRATRDSAGVHLRPAIAFVTQLPPKALPLGFSGELYAQAGYVGGSGRTAFLDLRAIAERALADETGAGLRAGGGVWLAGQRGARRLDVGPVLSLPLRLSSRTFARIEADWRVRVAGDARPDSGPALTLSAGF